MKNQKFEIRDTRSKEKFVIDDEYLNGYAKICGMSATCVYISLCRHVDKQQECFPSIKKIAEQHNISEKTVSRAIKILEKYNIIKKEKIRKKNGKWLNNLYILLDKKYWINKATPPESPVDNHKTITIKPQDNNDISTPPTGPTKVSHTKDTHTKDTHTKDTHITNVSNFTNEDIELTKNLYRQVKENYPFLLERKTEKQWESDYAEMNKIHRIDKRDYKTIEFIINWSQENDFWRKNIRSVNKLRKQFNTLLVQAYEDKQKNSSRFTSI